jgi:hypothetical protein
MNQSCETYEAHFTLHIIQNVYTTHNVLEYFVVLSLSLLLVVVVVVGVVAVVVVVTVVL